MNLGKNILCIRIDSMGDVIMTTPAFSAIKESVPQCKLTLLTSKTGGEVAPFIQTIDNILIADLPWERDTTNMTGEILSHFVNIIKEKNFDSAIIFTVYSQSSLPSALLCYLANIPIRVGYTTVNPHALLTQYLPDKTTTEIHEVTRQLTLVQSIGCTTKATRLSLTISRSAKVKVLEKLKKLHIPLDDKWIVVHPGATVPWRRYNNEHLILAGRQLKKDGYQLFFTGTLDEKELIEYITAGIGKGAYSLSGLFSLEEFIAFISLSPLLISNNTGPVHIAAATNTPIVDLYALTNPQHTPWKVKHKVLYFPIKEKKFYHSDNLPISINKMPLITSMDIVEAAKELLAQPLQKRQTLYE